jgi:predicted nucleic acid-binding Zn ribbon protein
MIRMTAQRRQRNVQMCMWSWLAFVGVLIVAILWR